MHEPSHLACAFWHATRNLIRVMLVGAALLAFSIYALAHSWYPLECCSEKDCFPVLAEQVKSVQGGWSLEDGTFIPFREARPSPDGQFHVCRYNDGKGSLINIPGKPACFWAPMGAS